MLSESINQFLTITVTGRVFMLCTGEGIKNAAQIKKYQKVIRNNLEQRALDGASKEALEESLIDELELLRQRINGIEPEKQARTGKSGKTKSRPKVASAKPVATNYRPDVAPLQEKLSIERKPLTDMLVKDCVFQHLLTPARAKYWAKNLSGRLIDEVEADIVSELSQNLHDNVKKYISKNSKSNPWSSHFKQTELIEEITSVKTIKGLVSLSSRINSDINALENSAKKSGSGLMKKIVEVLQK